MFRRLPWIPIAACLTLGLAAQNIQAQQCAVDSKARVAVGTYLVNVDLRSLGQEIEKFQQKNGRLPKDFDELRESLSEGWRRQTFLIVVAPFFVQGGPHLFGYTVETGNDWTVTLKPPASGYPWLQLRQTKVFLGQDPGKLSPTLDSDELDFPDLWAVLLQWWERIGDEHMLGVLNLFEVNRALLHRPDLAPELVGKDGFLDLGKIDEDLLGGPEAYHRAIRGTREKWEVVQWPKAYGPETRNTTCFQSSGDIRIGDVKGSDDCSLVPCL